MSNGTGIAWTDAFYPCKPDIFKATYESADDCCADPRDAEIVWLRAALEKALDAGAEAAAALGTLAEFNTAGAWLWSNLNRDSVEFAELESRRQYAALAEQRAWTILRPLLPPLPPTPDDPTGKSTP